MNTRVLELLKNPKNIQSEDLNLLKEEINSFPYIQNIRALHLYGVHLYDRENYQKELSVTAAYTTDKKILYQVINGKIQQPPKPEMVEEVKQEVIEPVQDSEIAVSNEIEKEVEPKTTPEKNQFEEAASLLQKPLTEVKPIYVNGERNRILFEGEENFLDEEHSETIDLESTLESGIIVTQKSEKIAEPSKEENTIAVEKSDLKETEEIAEPTTETIIEEEKITSEQAKSEINKDSELSFHETESFMPEVNLQKEKVSEIIPKNSLEEKINAAKVLAGFTPETIINEEKISSESEEKSVRDDSELSFHGFESFLPEVKIQSDKPEEIIKPGAPASNINKHEEEMRRLIEEVEKKMKVKKETQPEQIKEEPEIINHDISFAETQTFHIEPSEQKTEDKTEQKAELAENNNIIEEIQEPEKEIIEQKDPIIETKSEENSTWKPMSFESHVPDSLISKSVETSQPKTEIQEAPKQEIILPVIDKTPELVEDRSEKLETHVERFLEDKEVEKVESKEKDEEVPVMNVSFFSSDISSLEISEGNKKEEIEVTPSENDAPKPLDSNVPGFINTWQSWLKIERTEEIDHSKTESKIKAIDSFIENNPKISQLKDEVNFVVKEKTDDISHLMTETLAKLYLEQKLYTKATNAYQILANKHPDKKDYFEGKIQEIKDLRGKN